MKVTWPLFWSFSTDPEKQAASQAVLMQYYHDNFGVKLVEPSIPIESTPTIPVEDMSLEEIDKEMRRPPEHPRRVE